VRVRELIQADPTVREPAPGLDPEIAGLTADSRAVQTGYLFAALPGTRHDGSTFIPDAIKRGAVAVLGPHGVAVPGDIVRLESGNPRRSLALLAARFYGRQPRTIAAVTGTNGKTSVAAFTRQLWQLLGHPAASLGTLGLVAPHATRAGSLTTADPVALHKDLAELASAGVEHLAMEASSHGLDQFRLDGVRIAAAAFTNLTRDHLDYHGSMAAYEGAKQRLFADVMAPGGIAVLNADIPEFDRLSALCRRRGHRVISYGRKGLDLRLDRLEPLPDGQRLVVTIEGRPTTIMLPLVAAFQAMNALAALGLVIGCGADTQAATESLTRLDGVPGRMQRAAVRRNGAAIYVDYAHTPDAIETVLTALRPHAQRQLVILFGCGGDRDPGKRPMMGEIAQRLADRVIVTDDNPRSEDPAAIRKQILAACPQAQEIGSRRKAIFEATASLAAGDVLVLAGKGHERGQIVGNTVHPFDDAEVAREAVVAADGGPS
jgi:UDP-N-acetylmuramoyl-L-alanyl-D-glutamate--2,6-diaminopimelate ligase